MITIPPLAQGIFILMLNQADVIGDQSDAVTQNAWFRCMLWESTEDYVSSYLSRYQRSLIALLRLGILPLYIETGRFKNIKDEKTGLIRKTRPNERLCTLCDSKTIEDEIHFVCQCKKYEIYHKELYVYIE